MKASKFTTIPFSIVLIVYLIQAINIPTTKLSNYFVTFIQDSFLNIPVWITWLIIFYIVLPGLLFGYLYYCFLIHPKVIRNLSSITFLSASLFLVHFFKMIFGELNPKMSSILAESAIETYYCEKGFAMPSSYVFMTVCFGFLLRRNFFVIKNKKEDGTNIEKMTDQENEIEDTLVFKEHRFHYKDCNRFIINHSLKYNQFNLYFVILIFLVMFTSWTSGLASILQDFLTVILATIWSTFYYTFMENTLKKFNIDLILQPEKRFKSVRLFCIVNISLFLMNFVLFLMRSTFYSRNHKNIIHDGLKSKCPIGLLWFEKESFYTSLIIVFPLCVVLMFYLTPFRAKYYNEYKKRIIFEDLNREERLKRIAIFFLPIIFSILLYCLNEYLVANYMKKYFILSCFCFLIFLVSISFLIVIGYPFLFMKAGVLLRNEYVFPALGDDEFDDKPEIKSRKAIKPKIVVNVKTEISKNTVVDTNIEKKSSVEKVVSNKVDLKGSQEVKGNIE